jgi:hypothetical protein
MTRDLGDWLDDLTRAHTPEGIAVLQRLGLEAARRAGRAGVDADGLVTTPAFDPLDGALVDIIALDRKCDRGFRTLTGAAVMLGEPPFLGEVELYPLPRDWLRAGAHGLCVVNFEEARRYLCGKPPLHLSCRDHAHAAEVRSRLSLVMPRLTVAKSERRAA